MEKLDLVELTSQVGTGCYREIDGERLYNFKQVIITVNKPNGDKKKYIIGREAYKHSQFLHHIETYTLKADPWFHDDKHHARYKFYNTDEIFETKLKKLEKELSKLDYEIRVLN